ncbi:MAG TPA: decaprenyl-phosphate phosphoribosyltransferase [Phycisphaerae bacterium]|nr:decaprenyl-phosphate phosphoribosyltransferase [Phycisphaerae bacterium]
MFRTLRAAILLVRPAQWVKNVFVFGAFVFGANRADPHAFLHAFLLSLEAFAIFCLLSGAVYAFNDLLDYREDRLHPTKKRRPVASGAISPGSAGIISVILAAAAVAASLTMAQGFAVTAVTYLVLNAVYTIWGKQRAILDVILIAIGFVLRALAGAQAIQVEVSAWLVICTFTLCLFLGFGKRRCELAVMENAEKAVTHRPTLAAYSPELLTQLLSTTGGIAVITFLLYTLDPHTPSPHSLVFTTPLVFYAIFRYATVISRGQRTGPTDILINDRPFLLTALLWTAMTAGLIFHGEWVERYLPRLRYPGETATVQPAQPSDRPTS